MATTQELIDRLDHAIANQPTQRNPALSIIDLRQIRFELDRLRHGLRVISGHPGTGADLARSMREIAQNTLDPT